MGGFQALGPGIIPCIKLWFKMANKGKKKPKTPSNVIALNKKARYDYFIEDTLEAGIVLEGWEVKSLRAGRVQIGDSYVFVKNGEAFLSNAIITPLLSASTHIVANPTRVRKLLLHKKEIANLIGAVDRKGYTLIALKFYWKGSRAKVEIGLAKGKQKVDKRATEKERDWKRQKQRLLRDHA
jgi:SsrA-binding protein